LALFGYKSKLAIQMLHYCFNQLESTL